MIRNTVSLYSTPLALSLHKPQRITLKHKVQSRNFFAEDIKYLYNGLTPSLTRTPQCSTGYMALIQDYTIRILGQMLSFILQQRLGNRIAKN
jgi:hypothetical protein